MENTEKSRDIFDCTIRDSKTQTLHSERARYNQAMSKLEQRNHLLYKLIAPVLQEVCIENLGEFGRIAFTRVSLSKDGKYLDIFVFIESR